MIVPTEDPEFAALVRDADPHRPMHPRDALTLYERHWRFVDRDRLTDRETTLVRRLVADCGRGRFLA